ncbi:hypothetical protein COOONC_08760 [Cooperia oncophora]
MKRLLFALFVIGATLAWLPQPVPKPEVIGKGNQTVTAVLYTYILYDSKNSSEHKRFLNETKISEYFALMGDVDVVSLARHTITNSLTYSFNVKNADCKKIKLWMDQIVPSSPIYEAAQVYCPKPITPTPPDLEIKPVPKPAIIGKGSEMVAVEIYTSVVYDYDDRSAVNKYLDYFNKMKIEEHLESIGESGNLVLSGREGYVYYYFVIRKVYL